MFLTTMCSVIIAIILDYVSCLEFFQTHVSESRSLSIIRSKGVNAPTQLGPTVTAENISDRMVILVPIILQRVEPTDGEMGRYTRAVSGQWLSKHVPPAMNRHTTVEALLQTGCFCVVRAEML
jgi:hypothetical protein